MVDVYIKRSCWCVMIGSIFTHMHIHAAVSAGWTCSAKRAVFVFIRSSGQIYLCLASLPLYLASSVSHTLQLMIDRRSRGQAKPIAGPGHAAKIRIDPLLSTHTYTHSHKAPEDIYNGLVPVTLLCPVLFSTTLSIINSVCFPLHMCRAVCVFMHLFVSKVSL